MNRNLLAFAVLLIILGAASGYIQVSLIGLFLLLPAILTSPRPRPGPRKVPTSQAPQPRRITPRPASFMEPPTTATLASVQTTELLASAPQRPQQFPFSAPLFPNAMFPSLSSPLTSPGLPRETKEQPATPKDELLEIGAFLAIVKLVLG